jgi:hypothetical protein
MSSLLQTVQEPQTHGLVVALGDIFLGRTARRFETSRTATPVNSIWRSIGRLFARIKRTDVAKIRRTLIVLVKLAMMSP